jgi:uncharacterized circularly permuted ATP-grasp superfamily protein
VRTGEDEFFVLEDNARTPSGVSYMLENRETMLQMFPELFAQQGAAGQDYPQMLRGRWPRCAPPARGEATVAVLTPGIHNSAYFEHAFLADQMGVELVEGHDLRVDRRQGRHAHHAGYQPIDVLYRRVDDDFLDPLNFNPDSAGRAGDHGCLPRGRHHHRQCAGHRHRRRQGDLFSYMPEIVEFYTGEKPILKNVPTWRCSEAGVAAYVLDNLAELVVKEVHGSGGYGMLVGPPPARRRSRVPRSSRRGPATTSPSRRWRCRPCRS